jgi:hypothetical protein
MVNKLNIKERKLNKIAQKGPSDLPFVPLTTYYLIDEIKEYDMGEVCSRHLRGQNKTQNFSL